MLKSMIFSNSVFNFIKAQQLILAFVFVSFFNLDVCAKESIGQYGDQTNLYNYGKILQKVEVQTDVDNAKFVIKDGVPYLDIKDVGVVFHPAWTGIYALQYAGVESYYPKEVEINQKYFFRLVDLLEEKLIYIDKNSAVWLYNFDNTYNNVFIKSPWYSSFAQAIGIEVFVTAFEKTKDIKYLELAKKVAKPLITSIQNGGLLYEKDGDIWFEEIPLAKEPTHILNAQLRSLIALDVLYRHGSDAIYKDYFNRGLATLKKWLPRYDTGYWLKYDLNPNYKQLFRITNPYGFETVELPIDSISILDKYENVLIAEDLGDDDDFNSSKQIYLTGVDWREQYDDNNQTLRSIKASLPADFKTEFESDSIQSPYSFLNINFPIGEDKEYYLKIDYRDNKKGNLTLQKRSISPNIKFKDVSGGIFLMKGDNQNRSLVVRLDEANLGFYTGIDYAWKHYLYLKRLEEVTRDQDIQKWVNISKSYLNTIEYNTDEIVKNESLVLPQQTPMMPVYSFDYEGVIRQHTVDKDKTVLRNGLYDFDTPVGKPLYSPFIISKQLMHGNRMFTKDDIVDYSRWKVSSKDYYTSELWISHSNLDKIDKEPALNWLKNNCNIYNDALVWFFSFSNSYNDVVQETMWSSAFAQAYVIQALIENGIYDYATKGANAYKYDISNGGVSSFDKSGNIWFEEVPNKTHILNAHLISQNVLMQNLDKFQSKDIDIISKKGLDSLEKYINYFDSGYWSKYDQNPRKEILFQLDWIDGDKSPLLDEVCFISSVSHKKICLDIGEDKDYEGSNRITGLDWLSSFKEDGKTVRNFRNGYAQRAQDVKGGTRHNAFIWMSLPDREFSDQWDISPYYLMIKYKDISKGQFVVKSQSIREGNFLEFMPLYSSNIITIGDGKWKEHIIPIRNHDLGWYLGEDYHAYHIQQLNDLSNKKSNVLLQQVADRWEYYLEQYKNKQSPIVEPYVGFTKELYGYKIDSNLKFYNGYDLNKSIDGDPTSNYTASLENIELPHHITIDLEKEQFVDSIEIVWESYINNAMDFSVEVYNNLDLNFKEEIQNNSQYSKISISKNATRIIIKIKSYNGQNRLLLRAIRLFGK